MMPSAHIVKPQMVRIELCEILVPLFFQISISSLSTLDLGTHVIPTVCRSLNNQVADHICFLQPRVKSFVVSYPFLFIKFNISVRLRAHAAKFSL